MSTLDPIFAVLVDLDRPVSPRPEFEAALRTLLLDELREATSPGVARRLLSVPARRAGAKRQSPRRRWAGRLVLVLAVLVVVLAVAVAVAAAIGHSPFGTLGSWLNGKAGTPAPHSEQAGFSARNNAVYAAFPRGTKLRLLQRVSVGGKAFSLLGFRNGSSLCLRLTRADEPAAQGVNECVTLRELRASPAPVLVVSTAYFGLKDGRELGGIFGFADDTVRAILVHRSLGGLQTIVPRNNAFVALGAPWSTALYDPVARLQAVTRDGRRTSVPFSLQFEAPLPPGTPSYFLQRRVVFAGPRKAEDHLAVRTIGWLDKREPRGEPFTPNLHVFGPGGARVLFSRSVQPDPGNPFRVGISLIEVGPRAHGIVAGPVWGKTITLRAGQILLCVAELYPLRPSPIGYLCTTRTSSVSLIPIRHVLSVRTMFREVFTRVSGLAADGVREIDLFLSNGRMIPAALRDNVYTVEVPTAGFPANVVAFDARHRPVDVERIDLGNRITQVACPPAAVASRGTPAQPAAYERIDLATGSVAGRRILGRTQAEVARVLGRPQAIRPAMLLYGSKSPADAALTVFFGRRKRAVRLQYTDPNVADARLGRLLRLQPPDLQDRFAIAYGSRYALSFGYGSEPVLVGCSGVFRARSGGIELTFGLDPNRGARPFIRLSAPEPR